MMRQIIVWLGIAVLFGGLPFCAQAQSCTYLSTNTNFGSIPANPTAQTDTTATITVTCSGTVGQTIRMCMGLSPGDGTGSTLADRRMDDAGANFLQYQQYKDAARTQVYGRRNETPFPFKLDIPVVTATNNIGVITVYGRVFSGQTKPKGTYTSLYSAGSLRARAYRGYVVSPTDPDCDTYGSGSTEFAGPSVTAIIIPVCTVVAADLNFGTKATLATVTDATGTVQATCSLNDAYTIAMNGGTTTGNIANRQMTPSGGGATIGYQVYRDAARTLIWGDGTTGTVHSGTGNGAAQNITAYARVPVQTTPLSNIYLDNVTVTVTY